MPVWGTTDHDGRDHFSRWQLAGAFLIHNVDVWVLGRSCGSILFALS